MEMNARCSWDGVGVHADLIANGNVLKSDDARTIKQLRVRYGRRGWEVIEYRVTADKKIWRLVAIWTGNDMEGPGELVTEAKLYDRDNGITSMSFDMPTITLDEIVGLVDAVR